MKFENAWKAISRMPDPQEKVTIQIYKDLPELEFQTSQAVVV